MAFRQASCHSNPLRCATTDDDSRERSKLFVLSRPDGTASFGGAPGGAHPAQTVSLRQTRLVFKTGKRM